MIRKDSICRLPQLSRALLLLALGAGGVLAADPARDAYQSPYKVKFTFKEEELTGDLASGPRADWKDQATVPFREWYNTANQTRWTSWGPAAKHYSPPAGLSQKGPEWLRERIIAVGMRWIGYSYQHHHIPDWDPPADWPRSETQKTPSGKGLDCSNFTAFVYNIGLGIKPTGDVQDQAELTQVPGPGPGNRSIPVKRIELPQRYEDYMTTLQTGDLLFVNNNAGKLAHVVLWVGAIGDSPDGLPLVLDSTGTGSTDAKGNAIPDGIYLRPFKRSSWYASKASHVLRIIPEGRSPSSASPKS